MKKAVEINELTIVENNMFLLNNISLTFYSGLNTYICGVSGSGKTSLLRAIKGKISYLGEINTFCSVGVVLKPEMFLADTVENELKFLALDEEMRKMVAQFFDREELDLNPNQLSFAKKCYLNFCLELVQKPKILFVDSILNFMSKEDASKILKYLKRKKITLVMVSNEIEDALQFDYMIVLDKGIVAIEGKTLSVLKEERLLKRLGIGLPFYVDLSLQLKSYGLVDRIYLTKEELVECLWK